MREIAGRLAPAIEKQSETVIEDVARKFLGEGDPPSAYGTVADGDRAIAQLRMRCFLRGTIRAARKMAEDIGEVVADEGLVQLVATIRERLMTNAEQVPRGDGCAVTRVLCLR